MQGVFIGARAADYDCHGGSNTAAENTEKPDQMRALAIGAASATKFADKSAPTRIAVCPYSCAHSSATLFTLTSGRTI